MEGVSVLVSSLLSTDAKLTDDDDWLKCLLITSFRQMRAFFLKLLEAWYFSDKLLTALSNL